MKKLKNYIKLLRIHHYIKNFLVFAALGCSGQLFQLNKFTYAGFGFAAFCMTSSAIYIINDIRDKEKDQLHPIKCRRPIASGEVREKEALSLLAVVLLVAGLFNGIVYKPFSSFLLALYFLFNLFYSLGLKNKPLVDVAILTSGFLIRVLYGAVITEIEISNWLYLTVIVLAFYFSLGKRRNELTRTSANGETRKVLKYYTVAFLDKNMYMCLGLANTFYSLWCMDSSTISHYGKSLVFTIPMVLLITMKYSMDVEGNSDGDPVEVLLHDKVLLLLCVLYTLVMFVALYL